MTEVGPPRDAELASFVERYLVSFASWDLLVLLHSQPDLRETVAHLAYRLGREEADIAGAVREMVAGGIVEEVREDGEELYGLALGARPLLDRFSAATADREWRLDLVRRVLARIGTP